MATTSHVSAHVDLQVAFNALVDAMAYAGLSLEAAGRNMELFAAALSSACISSANDIKEPPRDVAPRKIRMICL